MLLPLVSIAMLPGLSVIRRIPSPHLPSCLGDATRLLQQTVAKQAIDKLFSSKLKEATTHIPNKLAQQVVRTYPHDSTRNINMQ
jgi:hypothetical protein